MPARTNGGSPPPSETYLRDLESQLVAEFGERNAQIEKFRRLRYMEEPVSIPDAYRVTTREVRTPIAREQLKRVIGSLVANEPAITVPPPSSSERARRNASKRATWTVAALRRMGDDASRDVFGMFIDALVADGAGVMKLVYLPDRWSGYPRRGDGGRGTGGGVQPARGPLQEVGAVSAGVARRRSADVLPVDRGGRHGGLPRDLGAPETTGHAAVRVGRGRPHGSPDPGG